ncbi:RNA polymerase sigma factor [Christensenellaceae bacterium NSJ-44]|uniref:RNA polymerase sigma factor n=1 Tax=Luoshenia tenuis TaxID=2763654 RepID=A0A926D192_9FIRM|nr:RNA polymerase sigma factor [Luoshenia tenuis]MBC8529591.1 RNA polymerase sigma factor [Luoshenia tenuis]
MIFAVVLAGGQEERRAQPLRIDETLFPRVGEGDRAAFEQLYQLTERALYAYVLSIVKDPHDTVDIVHATYVKIRCCAHLYQPMGKPLAWMFTIARNLANSLLRQGARTRPQGEEMPEEAYISEPLDRIVLKAALERLEQSESQIILLHLVSGLKHREIAQDLGIPLATVLSRYHRGLKKLRKILLEGGGYDAR